MGHSMKRLLCTCAVSAVAFWYLLRGFADVIRETWSKS